MLPSLSSRMHMTAQAGSSSRLASSRSAARNSMSAAASRTRTSTTGVGSFSQPRRNSANVWRRSSVASRSARARTSAITYASGSPDSRSSRSPPAPEHPHAEDPDAEAAQEERKRQRRVELGRSDGRSESACGDGEVLPLCATQFTEPNDRVLYEPRVHPLTRLERRASRSGRRGLPARRPSRATSGREGRGFRRRRGPRQPTRR